MCKEENKTIDSYILPCELSRARDCSHAAGDRKLNERSE